MTQNIKKMIMVKVENKPISFLTFLELIQTYSSDFWIDQSLIKTEYQPEEKVSLYFLCCKTLKQPQSVIHIILSEHNKSYQSYWQPSGNGDSVNGRWHYILHF